MDSAGRFSPQWTPSPTCAGLKSPFQGRSVGNSSPLTGAAGVPTAPTLPGKIRGVYFDERISRWRPRVSGSSAADFDHCLYFCGL